MLGIESDGKVKGCPSLQTTSYVGGTLRERSLEDLWTNTPELAFTRERTPDDPRTGLWGFCATCPFADVCLGGYTFTAHAFFGRPGNNPYCHYRARTLKARGRRERLVLRASAPGDPFDHALFDLVEEPWDAPEPDAKPARPLGLVKIRRKPPG